MNGSLQRCVLLHAPCGIFSTISISCLSVLGQGSLSGQLTLKDGADNYYTSTSQLQTEAGLGVVPRVHT